MTAGTPPPPWAGDGGRGQWPTPASRRPLHEATLQAEARSGVLRARPGLPHPGYRLWHCRASPKEVIRRSFPKSSEAESWLLPITPIGESL